jgi:hypothetical protein
LRDGKLIRSNKAFVTYYSSRPLDIWFQVNSMPCCETRAEVYRQYIVKTSVQKKNIQDKQNEQTFFHTSGSRKKSAHGIV